MLKPNGFPYYRTPPGLSPHVGASPVFSHTATATRGRGGPDGTLSDSYALSVTEKEASKPVHIHGSTSWPPVSTFFDPMKLTFLFPALWHLHEQLPHSVSGTTLCLPFHLFLYSETVIKNVI